MLRMPIISLLPPNTISADTRSRSERGGSVLKISS